MSRPLRALPAPSGPEAVATWWDPLDAALSGAGPALVPVPDGPAGAAVAAMAAVDRPLDVEDIALVVPTSGSTGVPKGALLRADALRAGAAATLARIGGPGRWLLALPVTHIAGLNVLVRSLISAQPPVAMDLSAGFSPAGFAAATGQLGGGRRYTALVPTQLARLLDGGAEPVAALASYDAVLLGGAAAPRRLLDRAAAAAVRVITTYGMSETCGGCVYDGTPLDGVAVRLEPGGRICLGGPVVFSGYRLRPAGDALQVRDATRWHLTRDAGQWTDGRLQVLGRVDDVIVTGAEKVAPLAVEEALVAIPGIAEAVVVGVADPQWGQVVAAAVPTAGDGPRPRLQAVREALRPILPAYALPRRLLALDRLPLIGTGKPDRAAVRELLSR